MRVLVAFFLVAATAFAGCTDSGDGGSADGFSITAADDPITQPYTFKATVTADSYRWDLGTGVDFADGKEVSHTYGFTNGKLRVKLTTSTAGENQTFTRTVELGTGLNNDPVVSLQQETNWATTAETVTFSGEDFTDDDGDAVYFAWLCFRKGDLAAGDGHGHDHGGGGDGVPFATGGGARPAVPAAGPLTPAATSLSDVCNDLDGSIAYSTEPSLTGAFPQTGVYSITMLAKDPKSASQAFEATIFVSDTRPQATIQENFTGTFTGGDGGTVQDFMETLGQDGIYDRVSHNFRLDLPNFATTFVVTPVGAEGGQVSYTVYQGETPLFVDQTTDLIVDGLGAGEYTVELILHQGNDVPYTLDITSTQDLNPLHLYQAL